MSLSFVLLFAAATATSPFQASPFGGKRSHAEITLVDATGATLALPAEPHHHSKSLKLPGRFTRTVWLQAKPGTDFRPVKLLFGAIDPTKGKDTVLVRLTADGDYLRAKLKEGLRGYRPLDESLPYADGDSPEPAKLADGHWVLELDKPLAAGDYALVSHTETWYFHVPALDH